jgi:hypothetical protein
MSHPLGTSPPDVFEERHALCFANVFIKHLSFDMIEYLFRTVHGLALFFVTPNGGCSYVLVHDLRETPITAKMSFLAADDTPHILAGTPTCS